MKVVGFNLLKMHVERKEMFDKIPKTTQKIDITSVEKEHIETTKQNVLKFRFRVTITYSDDVGKIEFIGNLITLPTEGEKTDVLNDWKKKKISEKYRYGLFNFIMNKCNVKALSFADELGLPLHIHFPKIVPNKK